MVSVAVGGDGDARSATTASARCDSRRSTLIVPTANVLEVYHFQSDACAVVKPNRPAIVASRFQTAYVDSLPAVEVRGAAKSRQANIKFKVHTIGNHVHDFDIESARRVRY